jgi:hypothetical protein
MEEGSGTGTIVKSSMLKWYLLSGEPRPTICTYRISSAAEFVPT